MAERNPARVLPEPVGAAMRVWRPAATASQACVWQGVGGAESRLEPGGDGGMEAVGGHGITEGYPG